MRYSVFWEELKVMGGSNPVERYPGGEKSEVDRDYHLCMIYKFDPPERGSDVNCTYSPWLGRTEHFPLIIKSLPATKLKGRTCKVR
jgi:hypothetical protein